MADDERKPMLWWKQILVSVASIGLPTPAARELREQMEHPPEPYRDTDPTALRVIRVYAIVFPLIVLAVVVLVIVSLLR
jgi:hypothetical protein